VILIPYAGVIAAWQFKLNRPSQQEISAIENDSSIPTLFTASLRSLRWLPTPPRIRHAIVGLFQSNAHNPPVYFLGQIWPKGTPYYFLAGLWLKIPVPLMLLIATGAGLAIGHLIRGLRPLTDLFWLLPPAIYLGLASLSALQLGVRLVLPTRAFLVIFTGFTLEWLRRLRYYPAVVSLVFVLLAVRVLPHFPHYISFFNLWAGGPDEGLTWLSDSNIDWGQDLPELARWVEINKPEKIRLAYFGADNPFAYIKDDRMEMVAPPWSPELVNGKRQFVPAPGLYAVSATLLTGQLFAPEYQDYFAPFRRLRPIAKAGYSIYIYRVN